MRVFWLFLVTTALFGQARIPGPGGSSSGCSSTPTTYSAGAFTTSTVPAGCTSVTMEAWSQGGQGGQSSGFTGGSGGGGGGYIKGTLAVTTGQVLTISVGATSADSTVKLGVTTEVVAFAAGAGGDNGGPGGGPGSGSVGGSATLVATFSGGTGGTGNGSDAGGGGGAATSSANGTNGSAPGGGSVGGGSGGSVGVSSGSAGSGLGGGGGGSGLADNASGSTGQIVITYH